MANSSMVASTIPKSPVYHGNRDVSLPLRAGELYSFIEGIRQSRVPSMYTILPRIAGDGCGKIDSRDYGTKKSPQAS
jgi:hypothetical protein